MLTTATPRTLVTALCSATLAAAALAPSAFAMPQDLRSPDTRDAATGVVSSSQDLRSPDARDAAAGTSSLAGTSSPTRQDLRAPDTRDAANGYAPVLESPTPVDSPSGGGFDWASAGIGVAAVGGLLLIVLATVGSHRIVVRRRPADV